MLSGGDGGVSWTEEASLGDFVVSQAARLAGQQAQASPPGPGA